MTKRLRLANWVAAAELPYLIAIAPALLLPTPQRLLVLVAVPIIWLAAWQSGRGWVARTPFNVAIWLMLGMVGVSIYATPDIRFSLGKIAGVVLGALVFWSLSRWLTTRDRLRRGEAGFVLAGGILAVLGLIGIEHSSKFAVLGALGSMVPRLIHGVPGAEDGFNPNGVAGGLVLLVPVQAARLLTARAWLNRRLVFVQALLLLLTSGTVLLMQSRTAWLGLVCGMVVLMLSHPRVRRRRAVLVLAALLVILAAATIARVSEAPTDEPLNSAVSVAQRVELWSKGIDAIRDSPITGTGMNMFRRLIPVQYPTFLIAPDFDVAHAHNHLLQAALDLGLPGLISYLALWLIAGGLLFQVVRQAADPEDQSLAAGLAGGLTASFVFGLADAIALGAKIGLLFWITLALVAAAHRIAALRDGSSARSAI